MSYRKQDFWIPPAAHAWVALMPSVENRPRGKARWPEKIERHVAPAAGPGRVRRMLDWLRRKSGALRLPELGSAAMDTKLQLR